METLAGVGRTNITPWWGVELTGFGYYLGRTWTRVRDPLAATALVLDDGKTAICWIAIDLMVIDRPFTALAREIIERETGILKDHILIGCSHCHTAPAAGGLLGVGAVDPDYERFAARQAATAAILAFRDRRPTRLSRASTILEGLLYNRTRSDGPIENHLTVLTGNDLATGATNFFVVNYQGHPTIQTVLGTSDVSRDWPGQLTDELETRAPGSTALFFMGASGDLNVLTEFESPSRCHEPAKIIAEKVEELITDAHDLGSNPSIAAKRDLAILPTRRWPREEVERELAEARRRLATNDVRGWRDTIGRVMVNRPDVFIQNRYGGDEIKGVRAMCRFSVEWIEKVLPELESRPETLEAEAQAFRVGDFFMAAQPSELFSEFSLSLREQFDAKDMMVVGYANERIGYIPDAADIAKKSYAAYQSPKYCLQFPFTEASGPALVAALLGALVSTRSG